MRCLAVVDTAFSIRDGEPWRAQHAHQTRSFCPISAYGPAYLISKTNVFDAAHQRT
jgi:hypothetical protein